MKASIYLCVFFMSMVYGRYAKYFSISDKIEDSLDIKSNFDKESSVTNQMDMDISKFSINLPTGYPTGSPAANMEIPTGIPTLSSSVPTLSPRKPTNNPSIVPSSVPSFPTAIPTSNPSTPPTISPSSMPSVPTNIPTAAPTTTPSQIPTLVPTTSPTSSPTGEPTGLPTSVPTFYPSSFPSGNPTNIPTESSPTISPSSMPSVPTNIPTAAHTTTPSMIPTSVPTTSPTSSPTGEPTGLPTSVPTFYPSSFPSGNPTNIPTESSPTISPSSMPSVPTNIPTAAPTTTPSQIPTSVPTTSPTSSPTGEPTGLPTSVPTFYPSNFPSGNPTNIPTESLSHIPSSSPTAIPSTSPTSAPTNIPTSKPSTSLTTVPTSSPTYLPTMSPSVRPTGFPTFSPSSLPTVLPTASPTTTPTALPTSIPTAIPSNNPSRSPTVIPTIKPTRIPTLKPSPSPTLTYQPSILPTTSYNHMEITNNTKQCFTDCPTYSNTWSKYDFCNFFLTTRNCSSIAMKSGDAVCDAPSCVSCIPKYQCSIYATMTLICPSGVSYSQSKESDLEQKCIATTVAKSTSKTSLEFHATVTMQNFDVASCTDNATLAVLSAACSNSTGGAACTVSTCELADRRRLHPSGNGRGRWGGGLRRYLSNGNVAINYIISMILENNGYTAGTASVAALSVASNLQTSVSSGSFVQTLQNAASAAGIDAFSDVVVNATVSTTSTTPAINFILTDSPTVSPTSKPTATPSSKPTSYAPTASIAISQHKDVSTSHVNLIIGLTVGIGGTFLILLLLVLYYCNRPKVISTEGQENITNSKPIVSHRRLSRINVNPLPTTSTGAEAARRHSATISEVRPFTDNDNDVFDSATASPKKRSSKVDTEFSEKSSIKKQRSPMVSTIAEYNPNNIEEMEEGPTRRSSAIAPATLFRCDTVDVQAPVKTTK